MTLPGPESGHLELPNWLVERLARLELTSTQWRIIWAVWRQTLCWQVSGGWGNRPYPISTQELAEATGVTERWVRRELKKLVGMKIILREKTPGGREHKTVTSFNLDPSTWEIKGGLSDPPLAPIKGGVSDPPLGPDRPPFRTESAPLYDPDRPPFTSVNHAWERNKETSKETSKERVFKLWNSLKLVEHTELTDERSQAIKAALEVHTVEELCQAIIDYSKALKEEGRFSDLQWSLEDFLGQGLEKFVPSKPPHDPLLAEISTLYEKKIGPLTPRLAEEFIEFCRTFEGPLAWVQEAFEEALSRKKRNWRYIRAILENWQEGGKPDVGRRGQRQRAPRQERARPITYTRGDGEAGGED